ncbi:hypothetical protein KC19_VG051400 [Ceratodon purpureus]|uniref:Uncharacterized protein n=1 Tax=Ceratodon purpureus TaxID=3225 RepID=A0A8T0HM60_CERPU|nr:hypothetical protein KC19_VG051400 [Ceratodon purpureus]KAG0571885.1 hypothetical protein KC19_VG051400 [Ceratodon purpureus]KAG0571886.1 hypothetical protein KC19_VG051400 [Ceratodon purpureus]
MTRSTAPSFQPRPSNQGHKRKGKPVETWMLELEKAQDEENGPQSLDLNAIEQIADGVEQMVFSWGLDKQERGQEYAKLSQSLAKENSHVLLPWSLNKTEGALHSASESEHTVARSDLKGIACNGATRARTPVIGIRRASPHAKQRGNSGSRRERSLSPRHEADSENPQSLKAGGGAPQGKHESSKSLLSDTCHGVLTSSNRMRTCPTQNKGGTQHNFENRAREGSNFQAISAEQESMGGSIQLETKMVDSIAKKGHIVLHRKEADLWPYHEEGFPIWTPDAAPPSPERRQQQRVNNHTGNHFPLPILTREVAGSVSPMLSQSPLCTQSPSPRADIAQSSVVSNEHDGLLTSLTDPHENRPEGFISLLPFLDASPCCGEDTESVEVGGHTIKVSTLRGGIDVLEDKFQSLVGINAGVQEEHDHLKPSSKADVEELQIALLECAMEYEIKTIEAKMKMQELKLKGQHAIAVTKGEQRCLQRVVEPVPACERPVDNQRLQLLKKRMAKLQHEKGNISNELHALKKKERQFERQKRSLEDALLRVNRLQREVVKKDQEVVEWQLKEKETKAQLQEIDEKLKRERHAQMSQPLEPKKLLNLLPALREWLRSLKKVPYNVDSLTLDEIFHEE